MTTQGVRTPLAWLSGPPGAGKPIDLIHPIRCSDADPKAVVIARDIDERGSTAKRYISADAVMVRTTQMRF